MLTIRPAEVADIAVIQDDLREDDLRELKAVGFETPRQALLVGAMHSVPFLAVTYGDTVLALGGLTETGEELARHCWLLSTPGIEDHWVPFARMSRPLIEAMNREHPVLTNKVGEWNTLHRRWLRWCGFQELSRDSSGMIEIVRINKCAHP